VGKDQVKQDISTSNAKITKVLKELVNGNGKDDFVFEVDGTKIWDRAVNRYLEQFDVSAKDLRGFQANRLMRDALKHKDWDEALEEVAKTVGHEKATLKNQYLEPSLVEKYTTKPTKKAEISKRALLNQDDANWLANVKPSTTTITQQPAQQTQAPTQNQQLRIQPGVKTNQLIVDAWKTLLPFLPPSAVMTSGTRTPDDQRRILRYYWGQAGFTPQTPGYGDYFAMSRTLIQNGWIVGPPATKAATSHLGGTAIDIGGAGLDEIAEAIQVVSEHPDLPVRFTKPLVEEKNNDVHVGIISARYDENAIAKVLQEIRGSDTRVASIKEPVKTAALATITREELERIYELEYKIAMLKARKSTSHQVQHMERKLGELLIKGIAAIKEGFEARLSSFDANYKAWKEELCNNMTEEQAEEEAYKRVYLISPTYQNLKAIYDQLKRAPTGNVMEDSALFNKALNATHYTGKMAEYLMPPEEITNELLTDLTTGTKYTPKWDAEIEHIASEITQMRKLSIRYDDNIIKEEPMPSKVRQILYNLSDSYTAEQGNKAKGTIIVSKDPDVDIKWYFLNNTEMPTTSPAKYQAYAILERRQPDATDQEIVFDMGSDDAVGLAEKMAATIKGLLDDLAGDVTQQIQQQELKRQELRSLNVESLVGISKRAEESEVASVLEDLMKSDAPNELKAEFLNDEADDKLKIEVGPEEQRVFDLLKEVKEHYGLKDVELRVVGGWVRDKVLEQMRK
jgi:hypothetical protein